MLFIAAYLGTHSRPAKRANLCLVILSKEPSQIIYHVYLTIVSLNAVLAKAMTIELVL